MNESGCVTRHIRFFIKIVRICQTQKFRIVQAYKYKQMFYKNLDKYMNKY